jgi:hypothetical protein
LIIINTYRIAALIPEILYDMDDQWPFSSREKLMHSARGNNALSWQIHVHVYPAYSSQWCVYLEVCWPLSIFWAPKSRSYLIDQWYELVGLHLSSQKESSFYHERDKKYQRESWNGTRKMTSLVVLIIDFTTCSLEKRLNQSDTNRKTWI